MSPLAVPTDAMLSVPHPIPARVLHEGISLDESYHLMIVTGLLSTAPPLDKWQSGVTYVKDEKGVPVPGIPFQGQLKEEY